MSRQNFTSPVLVKAPKWKQPICPPAGKGVMHCSSAVVQCEEGIADMWSTSGITVWNERNKTKEGKEEYLLHDSPYRTVCILVVGGG